jgi:hypothetical protein
MTPISIDGKDYDADALSAAAKAQLMSLQVTDQKIAELQSQMAIYQTARAAYASALLAELPPTHTVADAEPSNLVH